MSGNIIKTIFLGLVLSLSAQAQEVKVRGGFLQEHFEVGDNVDFWLSVSYPEELEVLLPDSTFNFSPFEYSAKNYYPSKLNGGIVSDTAIYTLQCFEVDQVQHLKLPAILLAKGDSTLIYSKIDSILFNPLVMEISDTTQLKTNLKYVEVSTGFNHLLLWISLGVFILLLGVALAIFGKKILRTIKLRKLKKDYIRFSDELTAHIRNLKSSPNKEIAESAISLWKHFAERLENVPYAKMTSKEILSLGYTKELTDPLKEIDRYVYGGMADGDIYKQFHSIEDFAQHRYSTIIEEIKSSK
ncbi:MAG: hypothetical protein JXR03_17840 [Cyclobacteriaceae bacterium]